MSLTFVLYVGLVALSTKAPKLRLLTVSYDRWWVRVPQLTWFPWGILFFNFFFLFTTDFFQWPTFVFLLRNTGKKQIAGHLLKSLTKRMQLSSRISPTKIGGDPHGGISPQYLSIQRIDASGPLEKPVSFS